MKQKVNRGSKVKEFLRGSYQELRNVDWPTWPEEVTDKLKKVLVTTVLFAAFLGFVDFICFQAIGLIF